MASHDVAGVCFTWPYAKGRLGKNYSEDRVKQLAATEAKVAQLLGAARAAGMTVRRCSFTLL